MFNFTGFICVLAAAVAAVAVLTGASVVFWLPVIAVPTLVALTFGLATFKEYAPERPDEYEWRRW